MIDEKVLIERLEEKYNEWCDIYNTESIKGVFDEFADGMGEGLGKSIEIVNQLAEEQNNGWIPCSERLPEENGKYLVCVDNPTRNRKNCIFAFWFNAYDKEFEREHDLDYVIAWQPLPAPYQPKGEQK